ncbi:MAG: protein phosphatase 2C domain-containing protein [Pseudonocardiales bacterium]|nr:protein phosphatase 2C domain-containing protein [Pseudonocardiales bacterium]
MSLVLRYFARSERGLVRQNNQDAVYAGPRVLALADGMGGHAAGEVASKLVITALSQLDDDEPGDDLLAELREATAEGNAAITRHITEEPDLEGMGTTLTAILFKGTRLGLVHVGDSRAYLLRDGAFSQITKDDTFVQSLIDEGRITPEEAQTHPQRSLLLRALTGHELEPSLTIREARAGDRYLLCSDGLSGVVSDETMAETLRLPDPQESADRLIELALRGGGPDNITVVVADVIDVDFGEDAPIVGGAADVGEQDDPPPNSAAARAAVTTLPRAQPKRVEPVAAVRRRWPPARRTVLGVVVVVGALALVGVLARVWVLQQYYVGSANDQVAIFQGVRGTVLGQDLHQVVEGACQDGSVGCTELSLADLQEDARSLVRDGIISNDGLAGARATVQRLRNQEMLLPCPLETVPVVPPPAPGAPVPGTPAPGTPVPPVAGTPTPTPPSADPALPSVQPEPGKTCRQVS